jgi:hypothetical protein
MAINVNPPPQIRIPEEWYSDANKRQFFQDINQSNDSVME